MTIKKIIILTATGFLLSACANARDTRLAQGAAIGGVGGAIVGGVATGTTGGAVAGGIIGAAAGAIVADITRPTTRTKRCYYSHKLERRVCRYR